MKLPARTRTVRAALIVVGVGLVLLASLAAGGGTSTQGLLSGVTTPHSRLRAGRPAPTAEGPEPAVQCWSALGDVDAIDDLTGFRTAVSSLLASGDPLIAEYLRERLAELIGEDPGRALDALTWAEDGERAERQLVLDALKASSAVRSPAVVARLLELGLDPEGDDERRADFIAALDTQPRLGGEALAGLAGVADDEGAGAAAMNAVRTIGKVMGTELAADGDPAPYMERLLDVATTAPDVEIRNAALEMPMQVDLRPDSATIGRLASVMTSDPDTDARLVAIHDMALGQDSSQVLRLYAQAFNADPDLCIRWALFRFAARAAGPAALPTMTAMAARDPRFQGDLLMFRALYARGIVDFEELWLALPDDDPHGCLHRDDPEEGDQ